MWPRCAPHFRATADNLRPTVIVLQSKMLPGALGMSLEPVDTSWPIFRWTGQSWGPPLVTVFSHPARNDKAWSWCANPYMQEIVAPTVRTNHQYLSIV